MRFEDTKDRVMHYAFIMMFGITLIPNAIRPYVIIVLGFAIVFTQPFFKKFSIKKAVINSAFFILLVLSLLYTKNLEYGFKKLETMSSLIIFPILFSFLSNKTINQLKSRKHIYMWVFAIAVLVFNVLFFLYHLNHYRLSLFQHYPTLMRYGAYAQHPIYISILIIIAIVFLVILFPNQKNKAKIFFALSGITLLLFLLILLKKGPIITLAIALSIYFLITKSTKFLRIYFCAIALICASIYLVPKLKSKFSQLFQIENIKSGTINSVNIRYSIYPFTTKLIKESPILGYGVGDAKQQLIEAYNNEANLLYEERLNSHNQYVGIALMIGLLGLFVFLLVIGYNLIAGFRYDNKAFILLTTIFCTAMFYENILERESGVLFYSFLLGYFGLFNTKLN